MRPEVAVMAEFAHATRVMRELQDSMTDVRRAFEVTAADVDDLRRRLDRIAYGDEDDR